MGHNFQKLLLVQYNGLLVVRGPWSLVVEDLMHVIIVAISKAAVPPLHIVFVLTQAMSALPWKTGRSHGLMLSLVAVVMLRNHHSSPDRFHSDLGHVWIIAGIQIL